MYPFIHSLREKEISLWNWGIEKMQHTQETPKIRNEWMGQNAFCMCYDCLWHFLFVKETACSKTSVERYEKKKCYKGSLIVMTFFASWLGWSFRQEANRL